MILAWLAALLLLGVLVPGIELLWGSRRIAWLRQQGAGASVPSPLVSIVVAARDEAAKVERAVESLLAQSYPCLQVIVVNDRSTDATGDLLEALALKHPRLEVLHVTRLPPGWLGKNHALWQGSQVAKGQWLLFTDGDVLMEPSALARSMNYGQRRGLDHVAATPDVRMPGHFLNMFSLVFGFFFVLFTRPWRAAAQASPCHIGIGAFNLVRAATYFQAGGHARIALRPDDDLKLGKIIK